MALTVPSSASISVCISSSRSGHGASELRAPLIVSFQPLDRANPAAMSYSRKRMVSVNARPKRRDLIVPLAATIVGPGTEEAEKAEIVEEDVVFEQLAKELENASPLEIMDKALEKFGDDIAIAFSGAEDVALLQYAKLTRRPFRVFSLDTGRLHPETYYFFDEVEIYYGIRIEYVFPDAVEVQALVRNKGLFSFRRDGHEECCQVRKVRPLRRALEGVRAWITGQRKDQSPCTRSEVPVVQVDPVFEGRIGSLVKWNPLANVTGNDVWNFLRVMPPPVNPLHFQGYISIGCQPCTRPVLPGQHEREGRWWWEDAKVRESGLHKGNLKRGESATGNGNGSAQGNGSATVVALSRAGIENLLNLKDRREPWLVVLYSSCCQSCQAKETYSDELAEKLARMGVKLGKFRAEGEHFEFAFRELQLIGYPTILFFPKHSLQPIRKPHNERDVDSLLAFASALR